MPPFFCVLRAVSAVHAVCRHIVIEHFAVLLLFLLDMVQGVADFRAGEFENAGVVG